MHKLDRFGVKAPACLEDYDYRTQTWDNLGSDCKKQLHTALALLQGNPGQDSEAITASVRCAYCEGAIYHARHVEHFRRKNPRHYPELTFEWTNLFFACGSHAHCGHYKDRRNAPAYDPDDLIKPDEHDPEDYLYFHQYGEVRVREGLSPNGQRKAAETIRVFALNEGALAGSRNKVLSVYRKKLLGDLDELASWPLEDCEAYLQGEVEATRWDPYATTIKHFLLSETGKGQQA